jgi:hypothetical protein
MIDATHPAITSAHALATTEIARPSIRTSRTRRHREAPSDCRTAVSRWRVTARASIRFATLAPTTTSVSSVTMEKMARISRSKAWSTPPALAAYGVTSTGARSQRGGQLRSPGTPRCRGDVTSRRERRVANSARTRAVEEPGARRPIMTTTSSCAAAASYPCSGTQTSLHSPDNGPSNRGGPTPTMVAGRPLIVMREPTAAGERANRDCQMASEMIATSGAPGVSSAASKGRPLPSVMPSVSK